MRVAAAVLPGLWLAALLSTSPLQAQTVLEIAGGSGQPWRIAVVPFAWEADALRTLDPARLIEQNLLRYSGFEVLARDQMLSLPVASGEIVRRDWLLSDTDFVLIARVRGKEGRRLWVEWSLYDVSRGEVALTGTEPDVGRGLRNMLHRVSDRIHGYVLGVPGINSSRFVYVSAVRNRRGRTLYRLIQSDADGQGHKVLFSSNEPILAPAWSPDGRQVAFSTLDAGLLRIRILDLATGELRFPGPWGGNAGEPSFSPRGDYLAFTLSRDTNPDIYIYHLKSGKLTRLTRHFAIDAEPAWSADGSSIFFTSDRSGTAQIYHFNLLSGAIRRLTFFAGNDGRSRVLSDGQRVVFVRSRGELSYIALLDINTLAVRILTEGGRLDSPGVAPDDNTVIYSSSDGSGNYFSGLQIRGGSYFQLQDMGSAVRAPAWSPVYR